MSKDENYLATGDSGGYFKIWDISSLSDNINSQEEPIKELVYIKAHQKDVTCIDFVEIDSRRFIVTGSSDKNLHLFTMEGIQVGVFGRILWKLKDPTTYWKKKPRLGTPVPKRKLPDYFETRSPQRTMVQPGRKVVILENNNERSNSPPKSLQR